MGSELREAFEKAGLCRTGGDGSVIRFILFYFTFFLHRLRRKSRGAMKMKKSVGIAVECSLAFPECSLIVP
jgi:hypothetical protein